jgi:DNA-binding MarR family transcriptional regulator
VKLDASLGLLVSLVQKRIQQLITLELVPFEVTPQQLWVVLLLDDHKLGSVGEVGERIGIDKPAASRLVEQLVERGWARLEAGDGRRRSVELTAAGRRQAARFRQLALRLSAEIEHGLSADDKAPAAEVLARMMANLDSLMDKRSKNRSSGRARRSAR